MQAGIDRTLGLARKRGARMRFASRSGVIPEHWPSLLPPDEELASGNNARGCDGHVKPPKRAPC
jgi:hypothetical protein